ncbi:MAG: hypothetical protein GF399_00470 [Candidatus Coatesbacteria bacterium]|nr:hypothetical protein [Candidatus Coatesbacteria bacterium]
MAVFSGFMGLMTALVPLAAPVDVTEDTWLAEAPGDALVAVYMPGFEIDWAVLEDNPMIAMLVEDGWPPEEDDFPEVLRQYSLEELMGMIKGELLILGMPVDEQDAWEDDLGFYAAFRSVDANANELIVEVLRGSEELEPVELPFNPGGLEAFAVPDDNNSPLLAFDGEVLHVADDAELLGRVLGWTGGTLADDDDFQEALRELEDEALIAAYIDLAELLARERARDAEEWAEIDPEYAPEPPSEFELSLNALGGVLDRDGLLRAKLTWLEGGVAEDPVYRTLVDDRGRMGLAAKVPEPCLIFAEARVGGLVPLLVELIEEEDGEEAPAMIHALVEVLEEGFSGRLGFSLHGLPGEPQNEDIEETLDEIDLELDYADPRLVVYLETPDADGFLENLEDTLSDFDTPYQTPTLGGRRSVRIQPEEEDLPVYLLVLDEELVALCTDKTSAEWIVGQYGGAGNLGESEAFTATAAANTREGSLVLYADTTGLITAAEGPEFAAMMGGGSDIFSGIEALGLFAEAREECIYLETDYQSLQDLMVIFLGFAFTAFDEPVMIDEQGAQTAPATNKDQASVETQAESAPAQE